MKHTLQSITTKPHGQAINWSMPCYGRGFEDASGGLM